MTAVETMRLAFAPGLAVRAVPERGLIACREEQILAYGGESYVRLADLIDGARSRAEVLNALPTDDRTAAEEALATLERDRVVVAHPRAHADLGADAGWWTSIGVAPVTWRSALDATIVSVRALGRIDTEPLQASLQLAGAVLVDADAEAELRVVLTDDYLTDALSEINDQALDSGRPWLLARPGRATLLVGPVFVPDRGPCWECLAQRLRLRRTLVAASEWSGLDRGALGPQLPGSLGGLAASLIASEALRWLVERSGLSESTVLSLDSRNWESRRHHVVWRPQCPACGAGGEPAPAVARPVVLDPADPATGLSAELRGTDPQATIRRFEHHLSPLTGAVAYLDRRTGAEPMHAWISGGPVAHFHGERERWGGWGGQWSAGKGTTDESAKAGALCEELERYSGRWFGDEPFRIARADEIGPGAFEPNALMGFSERQFELRDRLNARPGGSLKAHIPERYDGRPIAFSPAWSLTAGEERWLPSAWCYFGFSAPGYGVCIPDSNGNAAGNSVAEAIVHGVLELIERDHVAIWWYNRLRRPAVELDTVAEPWLQTIRQRLAGRGRELWVLDLTADLGIPAAAAVSCDADGADVGLGFGAHLDLGRAAVRAVTELVQLGLGAPSAGMGTGPVAPLRADEDSYLRPDPEVPQSRAPDSELPTGPLAALARLRGALEGRGHELIVLDQTRPDIGLPVVKAVVPGLRHFWPRLAPGRLYDVPVALGWLSTPLAEDALNPDPPTS